jgi:predicted porin
MKLIQPLLITNLIFCNFQIAKATENELTLYGRVNMSVESSHMESGTATAPKSVSSTLNVISSATPSSGTHNTYMIDNSSRFGLKGTEYLGNGFNVVFQYETSLNSNALLRDTFIGMEHNQLGAFRLGRITTKNYVSWEGKNLNDINYDSGTTADKLWRGIVRLSSSMAYETLWINNFKASVQYSISENNAHTWAIQGDYKNGPTGVGLGYTSFQNGTGAISSFYEWTLNSAYDFGFLKFGALFESYKNTSLNTDLDAIHYIKTSFRFPIGKDTFTINLGRNNLGYNSTFNKNGHSYQYQFGYANNFSKRTHFYTFIQSYDADNSIANNSLLTFGIGLAHNF